VRVRSLQKKRPLGANHNTTVTSGISHSSHQQSKSQIQALAQRKQQLHPDRLAGCIKAILHARLDEIDRLKYQQSGQ
jgi:hypothetical protein